MKPENIKNSRAFDLHYTSNSPMYFIKKYSAM